MAALELAPVVFGKARAVAGSRSRGPQDPTRPWPGVVATGPVAFDTRCHTKFESFAERHIRFSMNDFTRVLLNRVRSSIQQGWIGAILLIIVFVLSRRDRWVVLFNFGKIDYSKRILTRFP